MTRESQPKGLTSAEAVARLAEFGPNALPQTPRKGLGRAVLDLLREPMLALLLAGGVIYLMFGDRAEALILLVFASFSIVVTLVQERRTERLLETLRDLSSPRALVLRDGRRSRIAGRDVVPGDLLILSDGDRVAADARLVSCEDLSADESLLTGESLPVQKRPAPGPWQAGSAPPRPGPEAASMVFGGSLITRGTGLAQVISTGANTEIGRIGGALATLQTDPPRLRRQILRLVRVFGLIAFLGAGAAVLLLGRATGDWLQAALGGIALGMALLPEEFPVVLTVFMAMGAWRISKVRVLTRRASAIESLGAATVLCTDKTGTLTENRMQVTEVRIAGAVLAPDKAEPALLAGLARAGRLASPPHGFDPMDRAFHDLAGRAAPDAGEKLVQSFGLRPDLLALCQIWEAGPAGGRIAAAKGAPEAVAMLCRLDAPARTAMEAEVTAMAKSGLRVIALAEADLPTGAHPAEPREIDFRFLGLAGLSDPLRAAVPQALKECGAAGLNVVMITGDHPQTARAIARQAGLAEGRILTGPEMALLSDAELTRALEGVNVFARVMPEQKLRIVQALKARGEIVAMTGDGVNDAPALKAADIGIAMGRRGTDVAREAASIVLLDDDFSAVVAAIRLGRRIYDNLRKAMVFIFAVHIPIAGLALAPLLFDLPLVFLPVHIAFLEMIIDPVCALVFEAENEEADAMTRPPRPPDAPLFSPGMAFWALVQGVLALGAVLVTYGSGLTQGLPVEELRALTFFTLVAVVVALVYVNRSYSASPLRALTSRNPALVFVPLGVGAALSFVLTLPGLARLFSFGPLHGHDGLTGLGAALGLFLVLELLKLPARRALLR